VATDHEHRLLSHLGPDILAPDWDPVAVASRVRADPERTIGERLLDQSVLAGIGTFYLAAETCFLRGVSPWSLVGEVADVEALLRLAHRLMSTNVERAVQVTTGDARRGEECWVHARSGRPCRRCGVSSGANRLLETGSNRKFTPLGRAGLELDVRRR
jgi:endonuclease-8